MVCLWKCFLSLGHSILSDLCGLQKQQQQKGCQLYGNESVGVGMGSCFILNKQYEYVSCTSVLSVILTSSLGRGFFDAHYKSFLLAAERKTRCFAGKIGNNFKYRSFLEVEVRGTYFARTELTADGQGLKAQWPQG